MDIPGEGTDIGIAATRKLFRFLGHSHHWLQSHVCLQKLPENLTPIVSQNPKPTRGAQAACSPYGYFTLSSTTAVKKGGTHHLLSPRSAKKDNTTQLSLLRTEVFPLADEQFPSSTASVKPGSR